MYKFHLKTFSWNIFCFVRNNLQQVIDLHLQSLLKIQKCIYSFICTFYDSPIATTRKSRASRASPRKMGQTPNCAICIYYTVVAHFSCRVQSYQNTTNDAGSNVITQHYPKVRPKTHCQSSQTCSFSGRRF